MDPRSIAERFNNRFIVDDLPNGDNSQVVINSNKLEALDLFQNDYVRLKGRFNRHTYAIVQADPEANPIRIRMNRVMRQNLSVNLGDLIILTPAPNLQYSSRIKIIPFMDDLEGLNILGYTVPDPAADPKDAKDSKEGKDKKAPPPPPPGPPPPNTFDLFDIAIAPYFKDKCRPVTQGDTFTVLTTALPVNREIEFKVVLTDPAPACIVMDGGEIFYKDTAIDRDEHEKENTKIGYSDLGGLGKELAMIREQVELPLRHPELFKAIGCKPPRGILLHGPPGCGKSTIGKAIANESGAFFFLLNGSEIMSSMAGESEKNLRKAFEICEQEALKAGEEEEVTVRNPAYNADDPAANDASVPPTIRKTIRREGCAILFIDEIDVLATNRKDTKGEVEKRIVSQLLTLMDGIKPRANVIVLGATNMPNSIDPALRRFGRFDREIVINVPDEAGRLEILAIHTRKLRLDPVSPVDLKAVAEKTHGFVGADLAQLCTEAAMVCVRESMETLLDTEGDDPLDAGVLNAIYVTNEHFDKALSTITPSTLRETIVEIPTTTWDDIGGLQNTKTELIELIQYPILYKDKFALAGIEPSRGALLFGPPGTGKSLLAKAIANECQCNYISIKGPEFLSKWVGESEQNLRNVFDKARQSAPCVLFFDEIESIATRRGSGSGGGSEVTDRMVNTFLTELDGVSKRKDVFMIAATNRPDTLDTALMRPGRLDSVIYIPLPDAEGRVAILRASLRKSNVDYGEVNLAQIAAVTEGYSGADLADICSRACKYGIKESVERFNSAMRALNGIKRERIKKWCAEHDVEYRTNAAFLNSLELPDEMVKEFEAQEEEISGKFNENIMVQGRHFEQAVRESRRSVPAEEVKRYESFRNQFSGGIGDAVPGSSLRNNSDSKVANFKFGHGRGVGRLGSARAAAAGPAAAKNDEDDMF